MSVLFQKETPFSVGGYWWRVPEHASDCRAGCPAKDGMNAAIVRDTQTGNFLAISYHDRDNIGPDREVIAAGLSVSHVLTAIGEMENARRK